jgi:2,4-dienoyl-CoA reductase-like NADH-dependent reductase (Old Yellow Enzyme family)
MRDYKLLTEFKLNSTELKNRIVLSPMIRCRASGNIPNELMAEYYKQSSGAGLIITEGKSSSRNEPGDLVTFGRPFIINTDLVDKFKKTGPYLKISKEMYFTTLMKMDILIIRCSITDKPNSKDRWIS